MKTYKFILAAKYKKGNETVELKVNESYKLDEKIGDNFVRRGAAVTEVVKHKNKKK